MNGGGEGGEEERSRNIEGGEAADMNRKLHQSSEAHPEMKCCCSVMFPLKFVVV